MRMQCNGAAINVETRPAGDYENFTETHNPTFPFGSVLWHEALTCAEYQFPTTYDEDLEYATRMHEAYDAIHSGERWDGLS